MKNSISEIIRTIAFALILAFLITALIKPTVVKGESMYPTIQPNNYLIINKVPYFAGMPKRGDIVVFKAHLYTPSGEEKDLIKRVIGLPGDRISIDNGMVCRNGKALKERYINAGGTPGIMDEITVEPDHIFVMGDNRANSLDSRDETVGQIALEDILGRVDLRLYPFNKIGLI